MRKLHCSNQSDWVRCRQDGKLTTKSRTTSFTLSAVDFWFQILQPRCTIKSSPPWFFTTIRTCKFVKAIHSSPTVRGLFYIVSYSASSAEAPKLCLFCWFRLLQLCAEARRSLGPRDERQLRRHLDSRSQEACAEWYRFWKYEIWPKVFFSVEVWFHEAYDVIRERNLRLQNLLQWNQPWYVADARIKQQ